jgi:hypothetical protein
MLHRESMHGFGVRDVCECIGWCAACNRAARCPGAGMALVGPAALALGTSPPPPNLCLQDNDVSKAPKAWKPLYDAAGVVLTLVAMNYLVSPFLVRCRLLLSLVVRPAAPLRSLRLCHLPHPPGPSVWRLAASRKQSLPPVPLCSPTLPLWLACGLLCIPPRLRVACGVWPPLLHPAVASALPAASRCVSLHASCCVSLLPAVSFLFSGFVVVRCVSAQALGWGNAVVVLSKFYFAGHIIIALLYIPVGMFKPPKAGSAAGGGGRTKQE